MIGWLRFAVSAVFIVTGLISFASGVIGNCRFGYVMNRVHAGGIGDTQGLFFIVLGLAAGEGSVMDILKLALLVVFMWNTSPVSSGALGAPSWWTKPIWTPSAR